MQEKLSRFLSLYNPSDKTLSENSCVTFGYYMNSKSMRIYLKN